MVLSQGVWAWGPGPGRPGPVLRARALGLGPGRGPQEEGLIEGLPRCGDGDEAKGESGGSQRTAYNIQPHPDPDPPRERPSRQPSAHSSPTQARKQG